MADDDEADRLPKSIEERLKFLWSGVFREASLTPAEVGDIADQLLADLDRRAIDHDES